LCLALALAERFIHGALAVARSAALRNGAVDDRYSKVLALHVLRRGDLDLLSLVLELACLAQRFISCGGHRPVYSARSAWPAARAEAQAHWKLNPPRCPVTSTASPTK